jgi:RNA polymerase sigma-70 factor (ECF subfamily)
MNDATNRSPIDENLDLVRLARTNREAFGELCDCYYPQIFRYCRRRLFRWDDAEEVVADVFLNVARSMRDFTGETHADFVRWVYSIAVNQVNAFLRKSQRRARLLVEAARNGTVRVAGAAAPEVSLAVLEWPSVYQSRQRLKLRDQSIIVLRFFEGMSHQQIAEILDMQPGAVRTAESRALDKMRRDLGVHS